MRGGIVKLLGSPGFASFWRDLIMMLVIYAGIRTNDTAVVSIGVCTYIIVETIKAERR